MKILFSLTGQSAAKLRNIHFRNKMKVGEGSTTRWKWANCM